MYSGPCGYVRTYFFLLAEPENQPIGSPDIPAGIHGFWMSGQEFLERCSVLNITALTFFYSIQALIWDIQQMPRAIEDPILAYTAAEGEINQIQWGATQPDWIGGVDQHQPILFS